MIGLVRLVHPAPAAAVVGLSAALAAILIVQSGGSAVGPRVILTILAVAGSQIATGALNDWADRARDAVGQPTKPIPAGQVSPRAALGLSAAGLALQLAASVPLGVLPLTLGLVAVASAAAYNLWLSRTGLSFVPYLVSFGVLPLWVAAGVELPLERVALAPIIVGPFAVAAHLANTMRDFAVDAALGSRNLAQRLGRRGAFAVAWGLAVSVGVGAGIGLAAAGSLGPASLAIGAIGLVAVIQGWGSPSRLWAGMLVAAVCWATAWALATG